MTGNSRPWRKRSGPGSEHPSRPSSSEGSGDDWVRNGAARQFDIRTEVDVLNAGRETWKLCTDMGFSGVEAMQIRTAFSELGRNILKYAETGEVLVKTIGEEGVQLDFIDQGPGIEDIEQAMAYGFSTGGSLGLGLPGSRKLADRFDIRSAPGQGTRISFVKYKRRAVARRTDAILRGVHRKDKPRESERPRRQRRRPSEPVERKEEWWNKRNRKS